MGLPLLGISLSAMLTMLAQGIARASERGHGNPYGRAMAAGSMLTIVPTLAYLTYLASSPQRLNKAWEPSYFHGQGLAISLFAVSVAFLTAIYSDGYYSGHRVGPIACLPILIMFLMVANGYGI